MSFDYIGKNLGELLSEIETLEKKCGREVTLVAVTKSGSDEELIALAEAGVSDIGENRPTELKRRGDLLRSHGYSPRLHEIGNLQRNKVKLVISDAHLIHSVGSITLAEEIDKQAKKHGIVMKVLVEINAENEESKSGIALEDVEAFLQEVSKFENIKVMGLMSIPPIMTDEEAQRKIFEKIYKIYVDISQKNIHNISMVYLSLGMSDDYHIAIEEGANIVRVGTALFGKRNYAN